MTGDEAKAVAARFVTFLETNEVQPGLFAETVFLDLTMPRWRLQAEGVAQVIAIRRENHPSPGTVPRWRCDPTPSGFVLELEERWRDDKSEWYCRELFRADVEGTLITSLSVYCTGDWDAARQAEHVQAVRLLRP